MLQTLLSRFAAAPLPCDNGGKLLGIFPSWHYYLDHAPDALGRCTVVLRKVNVNGVQSFDLGQLWLIGLAVLEDLLRLAGIVAVAFVIWGGIQYIISQGEPDKTKNAMQTIINALVGVAIAIIASALVAFVAGRLTT